MERSWHFAFFPLCRPMMYQETRTPSTHDQRYASQPNQLCTLLLHSGLADSQGLVWFGDTRVELVSIHLYIHGTHARNSLLDADGLMKKATSFRSTGLTTAAQQVFVPISNAPEFKFNHWHTIRTKNELNPLLWHSIRAPL